MKALSLWQPYATLIALNAKHYETRHWSTRYRGLLAIHAAKRFTNYEVGLFNAFRRRFPNEMRGYKEPMPFGAVVCIVNLIGVYETESLRGALSLSEITFGDYTPGRFAWHLELVEVFDTPIPALGRQGLWNWERPNAD